MSQVYSEIARLARRGLVVGVLLVIGALAAYLLFEHRRRLVRDGVLVVGCDVSDDEALASLISFTSPDQVDESGSSLAFDRIEAFQNGVFDGAGSCGIGG